jgi:hypothetical protein
MTGHDDFDRTLADWFEGDARSPAPADGLDRVLDATRRRRPRLAWLAGPGSHWVGEVHDAGSNSGTRSLPRVSLRWSTALILLLVVAALVGGAILVGARLFQPSPLPTGRLGHLAYGLDGDIFVAGWDGRNPVRIADGHADGRTDCQGFWGEGPIWSPDGRHLGYRSGNDCDHSPGTLYLSDPEGHSVASFPATGWLVSWSPDSKRVATWVDFGKTIGIYGLDGVRQTLLTVPPGCGLPGDFDPVWSPDATSLVIAGCIVPVDGRTPGRVPAADPRSHFDIAYSRDGARLAYIAYPESVSLVIAKADGTELRVLAGALTVDNGGGPGAAYEDPVLSPTGDQVAFIWSPARYDLQALDQSSSTYELRAVDIASGTVTTLATASGASPLHPIRFSPEGDQILFSRTDANNDTSLWSVHVDGSDAQLLVPGSGWGDWQTLPAGP